jgi:peptidoglycan/xylan/chitin deacetylase (PgdA/CDA1 family)
MQRGYTFAVVLGTFLGLPGALVAEPALAQQCPGHPDALGTSRVLVLQPGELTQVGLMQYPQTLPLADKEVVFTFDDGPLAPYSEQVLDILAEQCIKATYFLVGEMARSNPDLVRRIHAEGHTIGTHTEDHPLRMRKMPVETVRWEIDQGIADVTAALGDPSELAPFFRIPGLSRSPIVEDEAAARSLIVFSSDTVADDWHRRIKPDDIIARAVSRLEKRGKGILLLHDIHPATVKALPGLLQELKEKGFHVVHVVPGAANPTAVASAPPPAATVSASTLTDDRSDQIAPTLPAPHAADTAVLPAPHAMAHAVDYRSGRRSFAGALSCRHGVFRHCHGGQTARSVWHRPAHQRHRISGGAPAA